MRYFAVSVLACSLLTGAALADDSQTGSSTSATDQPDAVVNLSGGSVAAGIGYVWGNGNLTYKGEKCRFSLSGVSIVDVGAAHMTASGRVYNLKNLSDFSGNYVTVAAGLTVAGGGYAAVLRNEHGVLIKLHATTRGLRVNLSAEGVDITLNRRA